MILYKVTENRKSWTRDCMPAELVREYHDGEIVEAAKDSPGILCFKTLQDALQFIIRYGVAPRHPEEYNTLEILQLEAITEPKEVRSLSSFNWTALGWIENKLAKFCALPPGTVGVDQIRVLRQIWRHE